MAGSATTPATSFAANPARAADAPVPVVVEPDHKMVFENAYVRVIDVQEFQFVPAQTALQIRNPGPRVAQCVLLELR